MPIDVRWYNPEKTIILMEFVSPWTWEDVYKKADESIQLIDSVGYTVDILHDWTKSNKVPPNALSHARNLIRKRHPRAGMSVAFGANPTLAAFWDILLRVSMILGIEPHYHLMKSLEEAHKQIVEIQSRRSKVEL